MHLWLYLLGVLAAATTLEEVYGPAPEVTSMLPFYARPPPPGFRNFKQAQPNPAFYASRRSDNCTFPIDLVILQDLTASFTDDLSNMVNTQLRLMMEGLVAQHPDTRVGVISFRDKPIWPLGESFSDYCVNFELPFTQNVTQLINEYTEFISMGGGDPPECQFTALSAAAQCEGLGWNLTSEAARLAVIVTDAQPHFEGDGFNQFDLPPYPGLFDEVNHPDQCLNYYYPSPDQVKADLESKEIYAGFLVYGGSYEAGLPRDSWQWFNSYIGQSPEFFQDLESDSSNFWAKLSEILVQLESLECIVETLEPVGTVVTIPESPPTPDLSTVTEVEPVSEKDVTIPRLSEDIQASAVPPIYSLVTEESQASAVPPIYSLVTEESQASVVPPTYSLVTEDTDASIVPPIYSLATEESEASAVPPIYSLVTEDTGASIVPPIYSLVTEDTGIIDETTVRGSGVAPVISLTNELPPFSPLTEQSAPAVTSVSDASAATAASPPGPSGELSSGTADNGTEPCVPCPPIGPCLPCEGSCCGPCDICDIRDGVLVKLRHRPKVMRFEIQN